MCKKIIDTVAGSITCKFGIDDCSKIFNCKKIDIVRNYSDTEMTSNGGRNYFEIGKGRG